MPLKLLYHIVRGIIILILHIFVITANRYGQTMTSYIKASLLKDPNIECYP